MADRRDFLRLAGTVGLCSPLAIAYVESKAPPPMPDEIGDMRLVRIATQCTCSALEFSSEGYRFGNTTARTAVSCDFCSTTYFDALQRYFDTFGNLPEILIVGLDNLYIVHELKEVIHRTGLNVGWTPEIRDCSWAVIGREGRVYSPGA